MRLEASIFQLRHGQATGIEKGMRNNKPQEKSKTPTVKETREKLFTAAKLGGFEDDIRRIFNRTDDLQKGAKTKEEREAIGIMAIHEINRVMNMHPTTSFKDDYGIDRHMTLNGKIVKGN